MTTLVAIAAWTAVATALALWLGPRLARRGCPCGTCGTPQPDTASSASRQHYINTGSYL